LICGSKSSLKPPKLLTQVMAAAAWRARKRDYQADRLKSRVKLEVAPEHPLQEGFGKQEEEAAEAERAKQRKMETSINADFDDPLSMIMKGELDPLSKLVESTPASNARTATALRSMDVSQADTDVSKMSILQQWELRKKEILAVCTLSGRITVTKPDLTKIGSGDVDVSHALSLGSSNDRLKVLEKTVKSPDTKEETVSYSQDEYVDNINKLKNQITEAWNKEQRVNALKKAIMCVKMLADTRVPQFYPSMYVLISGILDAFCELVFQRLKGRSEDFAKKHGKPRILPKDFTPDDVSPEAKETCRNWFFKIACIRELLPRILIEACLIPNYTFLTKSEFPRVISRLAHCIRGIGDPMVALYARLYLASVSHKVMPHNVAPIVSMFDDYLFTFREFKQEKVRKLALANGTTMEQYIFQHTYAIEFILRFASPGITPEICGGMMKRYNKNSKHLAVLTCILKVASPEFCAQNALKLVSFIKDSEATAMGNRSTALAAIGSRFCVLPPPEDQRLAVLNEAWKMIKNESDFSKYSKCVAVYMELLVKFYSEREVRILLKDLLKHANTVLAEDPSIVEANGGSLETVIEMLMRHAEDRGFGHILTSQHFMEVVDLFKGAKKLGVCKSLLQKFTAGSQSTSDPIIIHTVFDLARYLHDSIDYLSLKAEREDISKLICRFIERIDFGRSLEQQLNVYVDCRAGFANLDRVNIRLVLCTMRLAMKTHTIVRGRHTKRTSGFTKACLAFCHVTIPTVDDVFRRMYLFAQCGQVALVNQATSQAEAFFAEAIALLPTIPEVEPQTGRETEARVAECCCSMASSLVVCPGRPKDPLYVLDKLLDAIPECQCWSEASGARASLYIEMLSLICALSQRKLPYHISLVQSNDELFGSSNTKYVLKLAEYMQKICGDLKDSISVMRDSHDSSPLSEIGSKVALRFLNQILSSMVLSKDALELAKWLSTRIVETTPRAGSALANGLQQTKEYVDRAARAALLASTSQSIPLQDLQRHLNQL